MQLVVIFVTFAIAWIGHPKLYIIMHRLFNSLRLFREAFMALRREIFASLVILIFVTLCFTVVLWIAEYRNNPDYTLWDAMVWVVVKYVEDPADVVTPPVTIFGQVIGTLVGVLGIAIFAVPAGLIGSGLLDAMAEDKQHAEIVRNGKLLHKRFRRVVQSASWVYNERGHKIPLKGVPRYRTLSHIIMKTGMTDDDIVKVVNNCPDMRLMSTASTRQGEAKMHDELVVVHFPLNREYGCCVDRGSDVTIVAPSATTELGTGNFAFSLAAMGGFNYVSKELTPNPDDPFGFYTMQKAKLNLIGEYDLKEDVESQALHFMDDLKRLRTASEGAGRNHWFIFLMATSKTADYQMHLWRLATDTQEALPTIMKGDVRYGSTIKREDEERYNEIIAAMSERLGARSIEVGGVSRNIAITVDNNDILKSVSSSNIMCRMGGGDACNAITLRVGYDILCYSDKHLIIAKDVAEAIKSVVEPTHEIDDATKRCFLEEGDGFADAFGETTIFESDAERLQRMIDRGNREARKRFEHLDLDGNEQHIPKRRLFGRKHK